MNLKLYTTDEAAEILRCTHRQIDRYIEQGKLEAVRPSSRKTLISTEAIETFVRTWSTATISSKKSAPKMGDEVASEASEPRRKV